MSVLPQDETGKAEHGYDYDFEMAKTVVYVDDGAGGVVIWDGTADFGGDVTVDPDVSVLDSGNSTTTPLSGGATFTGTGKDLIGFSSVAITVYASHDSAADGMQFQFSMDNTNWDDVYSFNIDFSESPTRRFQFPVCAQYFRFVYTNGGSAQSAFRVQTILHRSNILTSIHDVDGTVVGDRSCQLVKAVVAGETTAGGGAFVNVKVNASGALTAEVDIETDAFTEDQLQDYFFSGYLVSGTAVYLGYEDKGGDYYVQYIETSTGVVTYAVGTGGIVAIGSYSGLSYDTFATQF